MKLYIRIFILLSLLLSANAKAESNAQALLYIQPFEYDHDIRLSYVWREYWYAQGPLVEPIAKEKLAKVYGNVRMCEGNDTGQMLIWLQPRMFYNGQAKLFFGKITANVYTGQGKLLQAYSAEAKEFGSLDIAPDYHIAQAYTKAMEKLVSKMQADSALQSLTNNTSVGNTPCSMVTLLPQPKVRAMGF